MFATMSVLIIGALLYALVLDYDLKKRHTEKHTPARIPIPKPQRPNLAYCGFCRNHFVVAHNPPYGVIHQVLIGYAHIDGEYVPDPYVKHLHAITREELIGYAS